MAADLQKKSVLVKEGRGPVLSPPALEAGPPQPQVLGS